MDPGPGPAYEPEQLGLDGRRARAGLALAHDGQAAALAQAELDRGRAGEVVCTGVARGDPELFPGARFELGGTGFAGGGFVVAGATHRIRASRGYLTEFTTAPPSPREGGASGGAADPVSVAHGVVTSLRDPLDLGRVQVRLPAYGELESDWMAVLVPGAGDSKGLVALPDVGDDVLVLFRDETTGQGVVLGGLYGRRGSPEPPVDGRTLRFALRTPGGQRVVLDDAARSARVEVAGGSFLELAPGGVRLHAAADLTIEAPGRSIVIGARRVDFAGRG